MRSHQGAPPLKPEDFARCDEITLKEFQSKSPSMKLSLCPSVAGVSRALNRSAF
jgi:hypothetical protein